MIKVAGIAPANVCQACRQPTLLSAYQSIQASSLPLSTHCHQIPTCLYSHTYTVSASTAPKGAPPGSTCSAVTPGSVRQRSKRSRSSFVSPLIRDSKEKRPKLNHTPSTHTDTIKGRLDFDGTCPEADKSSKVTGESSSRGDKDQLLCLREERDGLLSQLSDRREELRKLKMVKMYRTKVTLNCFSFALHAYK